MPLSRAAIGRPVPFALDLTSAASLSLCVAAAARAADPARTLLLSSGGHYVGEFNANFRPHGDGVEFHAGGLEAASGQWRDGKLHGRGKLTFLDGSCQSGQFTDCYSGLDAYTHSDEFRSLRMEGFGMRWQMRGHLTHCGLWKNGVLVESRPVPRSKISVGTPVSAAGTSRAAQLPLACRQQQSATPQR